MKKWYSSQDSYEKTCAILILAKEKLPRDLLIHVLSFVYEENGQTRECDNCHTLCLQDNLRYCECSRYFCQECSSLPSISCAASHVDIKKTIPLVHFCCNYRKGCLKCVFDYQALRQCERCGRFWCTEKYYDWSLLSFLF